MDKQILEHFMYVAKTRRSCRNFKPDPLPEGAVENILEAGRWAMSGGNGQPWEFIVVTEPAMKKKLWETYREVNREYIFWTEQMRVRELRHPSFQRPGTLEEQVAKYDTMKGFDVAPVLICVLGDGRKQWCSLLAGHTFGRSVTPFTDSLACACQLMHLAAAAMGLASQWVTIHVQEEFKRILGIPDLLKLHSIIPVGYPNVESKCGRVPLHKIVHRERYEMSKFRSSRQIVEDLAERRKQTVITYRTTEESTEPQHPGEKQAD